MGHRVAGKKNFKQKIPRFTGVKECKYVEEEEEEEKNLKIVLQTVLKYN